MGEWVIKNCEYCGKEYKIYESRPGRSRFCSDKCFRANKNLRIPFICDYCGREFMAPRIKLKKIEDGRQHSLCCSKECAQKLKAPTIEFIKDFMDKSNYDLISTEYINAKQYLDFICRKHPEIGIQHANWSNLKSGYGCKCCSMSEGETRIYKWLCRHNIQFEPQKTFNDLIGLGGGKLSYDFYIPSYRLLIEYQGQFHDGNISVKSLQTPEALDKQKSHDKLKKDYTIQNDYLLLEVWYSDKNEIENILYNYFLNLNISYESSETAGM